MLKKIYIIAGIIPLLTNSVFAFDMGGISPVNPLDNRNDTYQQSVAIPTYSLKKGSLTRNSVKNQYTIAMDKFMQSNIRTSYQDFKVLIDNVVPNDYVYMRLTQEMASIGFFTLA